jgi:hypothetical protein
VPTPDSGTALIGTATAAGLVAGFYYATQRADVRAAIAEGIPYGSDRRKALRKRLGRKFAVTIVVLLLHLPLTVLFVLGAIDAIGSMATGEGVDAVKVAVVVVAGLALLHTCVIGNDISALIKRRSQVSVPRE